MTNLILASNQPTPSEGDSSPRVDFLEIARAIGAEVDYPRADRGIWASLERATASDLRQAWAASRRTTVSAYLSLSEKSGMPLALLGTRGRRHVMIAHHLTSPRKVALQRKLRWLNRVDAIVVLCREQESYLLQEAKLPREQVFCIPDKVDHRFFEPRIDVAVEDDLVVAVGRERRDYKTLAEAMRRLPQKRAIVVASSPWASRVAEGESGSVANNVRFLRGISFEELRRLYARASIVCLPLEAGTRYAAGINGLLEAMAMGKPIVATATPGLEGYLDSDAVTPVPAGDPSALAEALSVAPAAGAGLVGRALVDAGWNLDSYVQQIREIVAG